MHTGTSITIKVICQNRMLRESLLSRFNAVEDCIVAELPADAKQTDHLHEPLDVVIIQYHPSIFPLLQQLSAVDAKTLIIDADPLEVDVVGCLQLGAVGFLLKEAAFEEVMSAVGLIVGGKYVMRTSITARLCHQLNIIGKSTNCEFSMGLTALTLRERQVVRLMMEGLSNKELADRLHLSIYTVKTHVHSILEKLKIRSRIDLVNYFWTHDSYDLELGDESHANSQELTALRELDRPSTKIAVTPTNWTGI